MSKPIFDKKKQLTYIKSKLQLISYMVEQLNNNPYEVELKDFHSIEAALKELTKKTIIFNFRNETIKKKE